MKKVVNLLSLLFFDTLIKDWNAKPTKSKARWASATLFVVPTMVSLILETKRNPPNGPSDWPFVVLAVAFACALLLKRHIMNKST